MAILGILFYLAAIVAYIFIIVAAFQDEWWKGLLVLFISIYGLYYGLVEFEHDNKTLIVCLAFLGPIAAFVLIRMGAPTPPAVPAG